MKDYDGVFRQDIQAIRVNLYEITEKRIDVSIQACVADDSAKLRA